MCDLVFVYILLYQYLPFNYLFQTCLLDLLQNMLHAIMIFSQSSLFFVALKAGVQGLVLQYIAPYFFAGKKIKDRFGEYKHKVKK